MSERDSNTHASKPAKTNRSRRTSRSDADPETAPLASSRRRFLRLLAVGSLAAVAGAAAPPRRARAAATAKRASGAAPPPSAAVRKEIQNQKDYVARTLRTIRDYPLETGSPMAFVFRPVRASRVARKERRP